MASDDLYFSAGIIVLLLVLSGIFSGSETALTAAARARILQMAKDGSRAAARVLKLTENRERLIGAILLGNNLVNILASALATSLFLNLFGEQGVVYATLLMTALVLIFAEVLPKSYAIANPEWMALFVSRFIHIIVIMFAPIVLVVERIVGITLRLFGVSLAEDSAILSSADELRGNIDLQAEEGDLRKRDRDMLGSILDLEQVTVYDIMVHRRDMQMLDITLAPRDLITAVVSSPYTRLPLYDGSHDNIVGLLHAKDVLRAVRRSNGALNRFNPRRVMTKPWFTPETTTLKEQLDAFLERKTHFAIVVDEYGDIQGLVTLEDILEEIVGDIADEHDFDVPGVAAQADGSVMVEGAVAIRDLNRKFDWGLPDDDAASIAGLLIHAAEDIPIVGQTFRFHGFSFEVTGRRRNRITELLIRREDGPKPAPETDAH